MKEKKKEIPKNLLSSQVEKALKRAGLRARRIARMHGTPLHYMRNGKIIAEKP